jgi:peptide/nickel transport system permease protein
MTSYVVKRLGIAMVTMLALTLLLFAITQILPGNAANVILGQYHSAAAYDALRIQLGLNNPWYVQYGHWLGRALQGDFGTSVIMHQPVKSMVVEAALRSAQLASLAIVILAVLGVGLGVLSALRNGRLSDYSVASVAFIGISVPEFVTGILLIVFFTSYLGWLPADGYVSLAEDPVAWVSHMILPVCTLAFALLAHVILLTRTGMLEALGGLYVRAARARGLRESSIVLKHALPSGILPTVTVLALQFGSLIGDIVVVETVFAYPGIGRLTLQAIQQRDLPLIQGTILLSSAALLFANLMADVLYAFLNPRIRYGTADA